MFLKGLHFPANLSVKTRTCYLVPALALHKNLARSQSRISTILVSLRACLRQYVRNWQGIQLL
jgi:hypothetical protein